MINQIKIYYIIVIFIFKKITKFNNHTKTQKIPFKNIFSKYNETSKKKLSTTPNLNPTHTPPRSLNDPVHHRQQQQQRPSSAKTPSANNA